MTRIKPARQTVIRGAASAGALLLGGLFAVAGPASAATAAHRSHTPTGLVFQNTNPAGTNAVQVYQRRADGSLVTGALVPTGGTGTGTSLGDQGGVVRAGRLLFAVNAGDDTITSFAITRSGLVKRDVAGSGGDEPVSITVHDGLVYVLNAGDDSVSGLRVDRRGHLTPIANSTRPLSGTGVGAAQIEFDHRGARVVVTEKAVNRIETFRVDRRGLLRQGAVVGSVGAVPFGFDIDSRNHVIVSEAAPSALSSYRFAGTGLKVITGGLPDTQAAACWVEVSNNGRFAYTTNAASATISSYAIAANGSLTLLDATAAATAGGPTDLAESADGAYLYVRVGSGAIESYAIGSDGSLSFAGSASGAPAFGISGLAAF